MTHPTRACALYLPFPLLRIFYRFAKICRIVKEKEKKKEKKFRQYKKNSSSNNLY